MIMTRIDWLSISRSLKYRFSLFLPPTCLISCCYPDNTDVGVVGVPVLKGELDVGAALVGLAVGLNVVGGVGANEMPIPNVEKSPECKFLWQFAEEHGGFPQSCFELPGHCVVQPKYTLRLRNAGLLPP